MGRSTGLTDPQTSWVHATVTAGAHGLYVDENSRLRVWVRRKPAMRVGATIRLGDNRFELRRRPLTPVWNVPGPSNRSGSLRVVGLARLAMPVFLLLALARFLPGPWALVAALALAVVGGIWGRRTLTARKRATDPAALILVVAAMSAADVESIASRGPGSNALVGPMKPLPGAARSAAPRCRDPLAILTHPGSVHTLRERTVTIENCTTCATVGHKAKTYALWVAGQLRAVGARPELVSLSTYSPRFRESHVGTGKEQVDSDNPQSTQVFWEQREDEGPVGTSVAVPSGIRTVLPSLEVGAGLWAQEMESLLLQGGPREALPQRVLLEDVITTSSLQVRKRWENADQSGAGARLRIPIGMDSVGTRWIDLNKDGPHSLIVGGTGSGKSEFLGTLVLTLALTASPDDLRFVFIDYKGGAGLEHLRLLPHVEQSITDLDGSLTPWLLRALRALLTERKVRCREHGVRSVDEWRERKMSGAEPTPPPPRVVIVADEVNALAEQNPDLMEELVSVCRQGRSLGLHLVAAAQRAGGAISAQMRSVLDLRVALRCAEVPDSIDAVGSAAAARLPKVPGRAIVGDTAAQLAYVAEPERLVAMLRDLGDEGPPALAKPLPTSVTVAELYRLQKATVNNGQTGKMTMRPRNSRDKVIGLCEDPATCAPLPLEWSGAPLLIAGPTASRRQMEQVAEAVAWIAATNVDPEDPATGFPPVFRAQVDQLGLGGVANLLAELPRQTPAGSRAVLVVPNISETLHQIDQICGGDSSRAIMRNLVAASRAGSLTLIATDTNPRGEVRAFPSTLVHVPSTRVSALPELAQLIPHRDDSPLGSTTHWVSPSPGRFIATGLSTPWPHPTSNKRQSLTPPTYADGGTEKPKIALMPTNAPPPLDSLAAAANFAHGASGPPAPELPTSNPRVASGQDFLRLLGSVPAGRDQDGLRIQLITDHRLSDNALEQSLREALAQEGTKCHLEHLTQREFHRIDTDPHCVKLAREPRREVARVLASLDPVASPWILASLPLPPGHAVLIAAGVATRLELCLSDTISPPESRRDCSHTTNVGLAAY